MQLYSAGQAANLLGVHRDVVQAAIRGGAPEPSLRIGRNRAFTFDDVQRLRLWFVSNGRKVKEISFDQEPAAV